MKLEINDEVADAIVKSVLQDSLRGIINDIERLSEEALIRVLRPHEREDLGDAMVLKQVFSRVIEYYSTPDEFKEFMSEFK